MSARCQTYGLPISGCHSMHERELKVLHDREATTTRGCHLGYTDTLKIVFVLNMKLF